METTTLNPKATIEDLESTFVEHLNNHNVTNLVEAFYTNDAQFHVPNAPPAIGKKAITATFQGLLDNGLKSLALKTVDAGGSGDTIWNRGQYDLVFSTPQGPVNDTGTYVTIFARQSDGSFRCVVDIFNSDLPAN